MSKAVFDWLAGSHWSFERRFDNPKMPGLTACGEARFSIASLAPSTVTSIATTAAAKTKTKTGCLTYCERGTLSTGGTFTKRYTFTLTAQALVVTHADPHNKDQPFQDLVLTPNPQGAFECRASNFCAPDRYTSYWCFAPDFWRMHHDVSGPHKAYRIETLFRRRRTLGAAA